MEKKKEMQGKRIKARNLKPVEEKNAEMVGEVESNMTDWNKMLEISEADKKAFTDM